MLRTSFVPWMCSGVQAAHQSARSHAKSWAGKGDFCRKRASKRSVLLSVPSTSCWLVGTCSIHQNLLGTNHPRQLQHFCPQAWEHQLRFHCSSFSAHTQCGELITLGWEGSFGFTRPNATCFLHMQAKLSEASRAFCCSRPRQFWHFLANNVPLVKELKHLAHLGMGKAFCYWNASCAKGKSTQHMNNPRQPELGLATWPPRQYLHKSKCKGVLQSRYAEHGRFIWLMLDIKMSD